MKNVLWILLALVAGAALRLAIVPPGRAGAATVQRASSAGAEAAAIREVEGASAGDLARTRGAATAAETAEIDARGRAALRGRVLANGRPVPGARLELRGASRSQRWETRTDADGLFGFVDVPLGLRAELRPDPALGAVEGANGRSFLVIDVVPGAAPFDVHLVPAARLRVRVSGPSGLPPASAEIRLHRGAARGTTMIDRVRSRTAGATFQLVRGARGPLVVTARSGASFGWALVDWPGEGAVDEVHVQMELPGAIRGLVVPAAGPSGVVATSVEPSVPARRIARASEDGTFEFASLAPGRYELVADGRSSTAMEVQVHSGRTAGPVRLGETVAASAPISGRVVDARGAAVSGANVRATPAVAEASVHEQSTTTTRADGTFDLALSADGLHKVTASVSGLMRGTTSLASATVEPGDRSVELVMDSRASGSIRALVRAPEDVSAVRVVVGAALEGAVQIVRPGEVEIGPVPSGNAVVRFELGRVVVAEREVVVPSGGVLDLGPVDLARIGVVELTAIGPDEAPVEGVAVHVEPAAVHRKLPPDARSLVGTTDAEGRCAAAAIGTAPVRLVLIADGLAAEYLDLDGADAGTERTVRMREGADLQLEGLRPLMEGAQAWRITVASAASGETVRTRGINRFVGSLTVAALPLGAYTISVQPASQVAHSTVHGWAGDAALSRPGRRVVRLDLSARPEETR